MCCCGVITPSVLGNQPNCPPTPQPFLTELDLRIAHLPAASIDYLREAMPTMGAGAENNGSSTTSNGKEGVEKEKEFDYERFIDEVFFT